VSDGTANGTTFLKDIYLGGGNSLAKHFVEHGGKMYFTANSGELWVSDGTAAGTSKMEMFLKMTGEAAPLVSVGDRLYFTGFFTAHDTGISYDGGLAFLTPQ